MNEQKTGDLLRFMSVLFLTVMIYAGAIVIGLAIWPSLIPLWTVLSLAGLVLIFPYAIWLDGKMFR